MKIFWVLLMAAMVAGGCGKKPEPVRPVKAVKGTEAGSAAALEGRLDAAAKITGSQQRDEALQKVAEDAAGAKDVAIVKRAIGMIVGSTSKDQTAEACALALAKQGDTKTAGEIAQMISSTDTRDRTLAAIATGVK